MQGPRRQVRPRANEPVDPLGLLDGLGPDRCGLGEVARRAQVVLHDVGGEQLHDLEFPEEMPAARLHLRGLRRHALVRPLRHRHQPARNERRLQNRGPSIDLRAFSFARLRGLTRKLARLDDNALDAHQQRRRGGQSRTSSISRSSRAARFITSARRPSRRPGSKNNSKPRNGSRAFPS